MTTNLAEPDPAGTDLLVTGGTVSLRNSIVSDADDTDNTNNCVLSSGVSLAQNVGNLISNGNGNCTATPDNAHMGTEQTGPTLPPHYQLTSSSEAIGHRRRDLLRPAPPGPAWHHPNRRVAAMPGPWNSADRITSV